MEDIPSHSHHALQIFIGHDRDVSIEVNNQKLTGKCILIKSNTPHSVLENKNKLITILIDSDSYHAKHIQNSIIKDKDFIIINDLAINSFNSKEEVKQTINDVIKSISSLDQCICSPTDERIMKAKNIIDKSHEKKISINDLADEVFLSEGRLTHLFKDEVGIPLRRYLLWKRLKDALDLIINGKDITYAAYEAGFSDSSHLSRTFKETFGINISKIFKNSRFIQLIKM